MTLPFNDSLGNAVDDAIEAAFQNGYAEGARDALDNSEFSVKVDDEVSDTELLDLMNEDLLVLEASLDDWAPQVDFTLEVHEAVLENHSESGKELAEKVDELEARVDLLAELSATLFEGLAGLVEEVQGDVKTDAVYLDSLGEIVQSLAERLDLVEKGF